MNKLIIPLLALLLAGCGFHLRNALTLPVDLGPVRVVSPDPYSPLAEALSQALTRAGAAAPADPTATEGVATLEILSERWGDTPVSLDELGRAQEFSLRYATEFVMRDGQGKDVVPRQVIELSRDYIAPATDSRGKASERELLARELRRDMSAAVLRRIAVATRSSVTPSDEDFTPTPVPPRN